MYLHVTIYIMCVSIAISACISEHNFMHVCSSFLCMYVLVSSCICLQLKATSDEVAVDIWDGLGYTSVFQVQYHVFIALTRRSRVVIGPYHGPGVDIVQLAARPRPPLAVAHAPRESGILVTGHNSGDRPIIHRREPLAGTDGRGCARVEQRTQPDRERGCTGSWSRFPRCWASKLCPRWERGRRKVSTSQLLLSDALIQPPTMMPGRSASTGGLAITNSAPVRGRRRHTLKFYPSKH
jgi:hypothetical protein